MLDKQNNHRDLLPGQQLVLEDLVEVNLSLKAIDQGQEAEVGELTWAASALGRALRVRDYLGDHPALEQYKQPLSQSLELLATHEEWQEELLLDLQYSPLLAQLAERLGDQESTEMEIMHLLLELDRAICVLRLPIIVSKLSSDSDSEIVQRASMYVDMYPEGCAKVSTRINNYMQCHGVKDRWGVVLNKIVDSPKRASVLADIRADVEALDKRQPVEPFDFFAALGEESNEATEPPSIWKRLSELALAGFNDLSESLTSPSPTFISASADDGSISDDGLNLEYFKIETEALAKHPSIYECYLTYSNERDVSFNVEATRPSDMRVKIGMRVFKPDPEGISLTAPINLDAPQSTIELLIDNKVVYKTDLDSIVTQLERERASKV
jgi:hypothetical protein